MAYEKEDTHYLRKLGHRIRQCRELKAWSQEGLALRCGLDRTYIGGVERGERNISVLNLRRIARTLDVSPKEFLPEEN